VLRADRLAELKCRWSQALDQLSGLQPFPKGETKGKIVPIRFTKAEAERLTKAAKKNAQTLSEWIRRAVLAALGD
jgi:hypothetical protein